MTIRPFNTILRDFEIEGVPASGAHKPIKKDFRDSLNALVAGGSNASTRIIHLTNSGGTPNNIEVVASEEIPSAAYDVLFILDVTAENTGPVTISGAIERQLVTNTSQPIPSGYLQPGMAVLAVDTGTELRMLSYGDAEAIVALAEAAADRASDYADFARNNWVVAASALGNNIQTDFVLSIDPGSENNMFVTVDGVPQPVSAYELVYVTSTPTLRLSEPAPDTLKVEVRVSNAINVNTPSDGSVSSSKLASGAVETAKVADKAITLAKQADIATARLMGRVTAGSGSQEALTAAQVRDNFLPAGSMIDSVRGVYTANADITAGIPADDTIPQISEGAEIISVTLTPKSNTSKFRMRFTGQTTATGGPASTIAAIFAGPTGAVPADARGAILDLIDTASFTNILNLECEYTPGSTSQQTISVRVGVTTGSGHTMRMNGNTSTRRFGGASAATLVVEEIKG